MMWAYLALSTCTKDIAVSVFTMTLFVLRGVAEPNFEVFIE